MTNQFEENFNILNNLIDPDLPNLLYIIHEFLEEGKDFGGTSLHLRDLLSVVKERYNCFVFYFNKAGYDLCYIGKETVKFSFVCDKPADTSQFDEQYKTLFSDVLKLFNIDTVHIHQVINHSLDVFYCAKEAGCALYATVHDFYYLCPTLFMLNLKDEYCEIYGKDCGNCLEKRLGCRLDLIEYQTNSCKALECCDAVFAPSEFAKKEYNKIFPRLDITIIEHGCDYAAVIKKEKSSGDFKVAFVGAFSVKKGSGLIAQIVKKAKGFTPYLYGVMYDTKLSALGKHYVFKGKYNRLELGSILANDGIDAVCILSRLPETYCCTLSEVIPAGVPVVVLDIGALNRAKSIGGCVLLKSGVNADDIIQTIKGLKANKEKYDELCSSISNVKLKSVKEMADEYLSIYSKDAREKAVDYSLLTLYSRLFMHLGTALQESQEALNSPYWKVCRYIGDKRFFKKTIRERVERYYLKKKGTGE